MRIGELARRSGASPRSLRYYEQQGLLTSARDSNGYREYDEHALVRARAIKELLSVGLTTEDVHGYRAAGCLDTLPGDRPACTADLVTARERLARVADRIGELRQLHDQLAQYCADLAESLPAGADPRTETGRGAAGRGATDCGAAGRANTGHRARDRAPDRDRQELSAVERPVLG